MIKPRRIGHATFETPDLEKAIAYYEKFMGLIVAEREKDRAFLASKVASTGDMKIATPIATMGIRGTTGVVDVPEAGTTGEPRIKLYADADGHVGRIEVFDRQGARLGILSQGSSAFALRAGTGGRFTAVPFQIPPQEALRDRGVLQRLSASHAAGQRQTIERRQSRGVPTLAAPRAQSRARPHGLDR